MTDPAGDAVTDPVGVMVTLIAGVEPGLDRDAVRAVVTAVAGGRARQRRLAQALARRPAVLSDGRSPAPRAVGDLLIALVRAGATVILPPACTQCGKALRTLQRHGDDWYCTVCSEVREPCAACGRSRRIHSRDRAGRPRCAECPDDDGRDPVTVIHAIVAALDPGAGRGTVAAAVRRSAPRPSYQQKLAWALEENPALLTGDAHLAPLRAIPRFIEMLCARHAAAAAAWCASTSRWTASGSAGPASRIPAPSRAAAAEPSASPSPETARDGRSARTA